MRHPLLVCGALALSLASAAAAEWPLSRPKVTPVSKLVSTPSPANPTDRIYLTPRQLVHPGFSRAFDERIKSVLNVQSRMTYGDYVWDDHGVPAGPVWIRVDLRSQIISVFRADEEIGTAVILYGADQKETPEGVFPILAKDKDHRSSTYDAPMPYTLRLTSDGVSIHGSNVRWGFATHGCIGVPIPFAKLLFEQVRRGEDVVIVDGPAEQRA